jgi:hypothetical protein
MDASNYRSYNLGIQRLEVLGIYNSHRFYRRMYFRSLFLQTRDTQRGPPVKQTCRNCGYRKQNFVKEPCNSCCDYTGIPTYINWRSRRWPLFVAIIAIAAVLVLAASLLLYWAVIDPAHNPPKRGEVHYTDVVLTNEIPIDVDGLERVVTTRVLILGFGDNGTVYAVENDKQVTWFGGNYNK